MLMIDETQFNIHFRATYDNDTDILHILDTQHHEPFKSVTNGVNELLPYLEKQFDLKDDYRIYLYGTDAMIVEYRPINDNFILIDSFDPKINRLFKNEMLAIYT